MLKQDDLVKRPEYWLETIQNEIYRQVTTYLKDNNMNQTQLAIQLGVSKGYISQVMKGEFNYTLKKLIELSLAVGKAPVIIFKPLENTPNSDKEEFSLTSSSSLDRVADPGMTYTSLEE